jgi:signal transduction histidine kinase
MSGFLHNLIPSRIGSQIAGLIVASLAIANAVTTAVFLLQTPPTAAADARGVLAQLAFVARLLDVTPGAPARADVMRLARRSLPGLSEMSAPPPPAVGTQDNWLTRHLQTELGNRFTVIPVRPQEPRERPRIAVKLPDGETIAAELSPPPNNKPMLIGTVMFLAVVLTLLFLWVARALTAPLAHFADAAERFLVDRSDVPLNDRGPIEIRRLAGALNEMRERVRSVVDDRTRMLAAVGHDLRTPITRLRLRAEDIEQEPLRRQVIRDLDVMQQMVHAALSFLRELTVRKQHMPADLPSIVQALCDDFGDIGCEINVQGPPHLQVDCDPDQLTRAIANLVDNGLRYGISVSVRVIENADEVFIDVEDDGPGISIADRPKVIEPFYRGDTTRNLGEYGGFGLGLSIARSIIEAHRGRLELHDAQPRGLRARLVLPKSSRASDTTPAKLAAVA